MAATLAVRALPDAPPSPHTEVTVTAPAGASKFTMYRVDETTGERLYVRTAVGAGIATATVVSDFECSINRPIHYDALFYNAAGALVGPTISSASVTVGPGGACSGWLSAPAIPSLALSVEPINDGVTIRPVEQSILYPMGSRRAIVVSGTRHDREQTWSLVTRTTAARTALLSILNNANPVLLRLVYPAELAEGGYLAVAEVSEERYDDTDPLNPIRWWEFDTVVVASPDPSYGVAYHSWDELKASAPTWNYVRAHWAMWLDVLRNPTTPSVP